MRRGGVNQKLRLVQRGELAGLRYRPAGRRIWGGCTIRPDGWLDYIFDWRAQSGADVVVLIEDAAGGNCGRFVPDGHAHDGLRAGCVLDRLAHVRDPATTRRTTSSDT